MSVKTELVKNDRNSIWRRECEICNKDMKRLKEGDVICGSKWYHIGCWNLTKKEQELCHSNVNDILRIVDSFIDNNFIQTASADNTSSSSTPAEDTVTVEAIISSTMSKEER